MEAPEGSQIPSAAAPDKIFKKRVNNAIVCRLPVAAVAEKPIPLHIIRQTESGDMVGVIEDYDRSTTEENRVKANLRLRRINDARVSGGLDIGATADDIKDMGNFRLERVENKNGRPHEWWTFPQYGLTFIMRWRDGKDKNGKDVRDKLFIEKISLSQRTDSNDLRNNRSQIAGLEPRATRAEVVDALGEPEKPEPAPNRLELVDDKGRRKNESMHEPHARRGYRRPGSCGMDRNLQSLR